MSMIHASDYHSLEQLRDSLLTYVNEYNMRPHSSLENKSPHDRFFEESDHIIRMSNEQIDRCFLLEIERRVSEDNVIVLNDKEYEIDYRYHAEKILIRYSPDLKKVYVVNKNDQSLVELKLLDKKANSHVKRSRVLFTQKEES